MRVSIQDESTTCPKLPVGDDHHHRIIAPASRQSKEQKMKFNWRANWEILLVLVIIIIGIVITTIAAIRSKDKHHQLLVLPDDTNDYGGLAEPAISSQHQVPHLPQTDFQLHGSRESLALDEGGGGGGGNAYAATSSPFAATTTSTPSAAAAAGARRPAKPQPNSHSSSHHHNHHHWASTRKSAPVKQLNEARPSSSLDAHSPASTYESPSSHPSPAHDNYDALSTEPTPSQALRLNETARSTKGLGTSRRNVAQKHKTDQQPVPDGNELIVNDQQAEMLDDFHTTRSALAAQSQFPNALGEQPVLNSDGRAEEMLSASPAPPSLTMHGPYELLPSLAHNHNNQLAMHNRLIQQQQQQQANKSENQQAPPVIPILEPTDDMMTSYTRLPQNNLTEALMRDYNMATAATNHSSKSSDQQALQNLAGANQARHRANTVSLPFSMLLADIIRLTRPSSSSSLINTQAALEQPANSRPQYSILQQLRSLPGPLLALLQGSSASQTQQSDAANFAAQLPASHDASESSQHYQRISMSPSDILSRSLRATGTLPAFPPPKGTPQTWIAPNAGGAPINDAVSSNADFISSNTAGFVRDINSSSSANSQSATSQAGAQQTSQTNGSSQQHQSQDQSQMAYKQQQQPAELQQQQQQQQYQRQQQQQQSGDGINYPLLDEVPNGNQQQQQQQRQQQQVQQTSMKNPQAQASYQQQQDGGYRNFRQGQANQQAYLQQQAFQNNQMQGNMMQGANAYSLQAQMGQTMSQMSPPASLYRPRQTNSELFESIPNNVPLGYNPQYQQQQQQQLAMAQAAQSGFDFSAMSIESAPKASITSTGGSQANGKAPQTSARPSMEQSKRPVSSGTPPQGAQPIQLNAINRQRRAISPAELSRRQDDGSDALDDDEEEEYLDSRPMSIVSPDGRPMSGERVKILHHPKHQSAPPDLVAPASSGRQVNQQDLDESAMHHYASQSSPEPHKSKSKTEVEGAKGKSSIRHNNNKQEQARKSASAKQKAESQDGLERHNKKLHKKRLKKVKEDGSDDRHREPNTSHKGKRKQSGRQANNKRQKIGNGNLDTAGSGLMSKLLGTASSNSDEIDDDLDGDDDDGSSANERRKEEQDDAEFGIVNDGRNAGPSLSGGDTNSLGPVTAGPNDEVSRLSSNDALGAGPSDGTTGNGPMDNGGGDGDSSMSSGSAGSNSYTRRNQQQQQQRPDVEFYGHPGEETRQLKYGILGSGNYEVVNGGIYPDVDESTAAVNSVANYVRKPGGVLLAGLPKLLADAAAANQAGGGQQSAPVYMPGGRMSGVSGFMRGASAHPDELVGMFPPPLPPSAASAGKLAHLGNPLLELIDANSGHLFDPNLVAQLGSSGTSARTTFSSKEPGEHDQTTSDENNSTRGEMEAQKTTQSGNEMADERRSLKARAGGAKDSSARKRTKAGELDGYEIEQSQHQHAASALRRSKNRLAAEGERDAQTGSKGQGTNQFYSYQILPSKKVTIFSDQDLDSAPSELATTTTTTTSAKAVLWNRASSEAIVH